MDNQPKGAVIKSHYLSNLTYSSGDSTKTNTKYKFWNRLELKFWTQDL
jgi:hypothetical protein